MKTLLEILKKLYWRDFYYYASCHIDNFYKHEHISKETDHRYKMWNNDKRLLRLWQNGMTGYPIVDAAMRELNTTGFMHIILGFLIHGHNQKNMIHIVNIYTNGYLN